MPSRIKIEVINSKNNTTTSYDSIHEAARALNLPNHKQFRIILKIIKKSLIKVSILSP